MLNACVGQRRLIHLLVVFGTVFGLVFAMAAPAAGKKASYQTGFDRWRAADGAFANWNRNHVDLTADGELQLNLASAPIETDPYAAGSYLGRNFYNGGSFQVGEVTGPIVPVGFAFTEAIASWNASTPSGTWIETQIRAQFGERWTKWYNLGIWAANIGTIERHSVRLQGDGDGFVAVDTLVLTNKKEAAGAYQLKARLFSAAAGAAPAISAMSVATSTGATSPSSLSPGSPANWNTLLPVPECSQMVYPDGGEVWCSPTSTSMVLGYWQQEAGQSIDPCEPRVRSAVDGVFDWVYDGHGNWPFNTAYAAAQADIELEGYVARFTSFAEAEPWVKAGVPVVMSFAWKKGSLTGAAIPSSNGHLAVLVGFDAAGNPIVNDPAAATDADVQRTYDRAELETLWLETSGGTVYLIYPKGRSVPN
jgi:hypothetical protein